MSKYINVIVKVLFSISMIVVTAIIANYHCYAIYGDPASWTYSQTPAVGPLYTSETVRVYMEPVIGNPGPELQAELMTISENDIPLAEPQIQYYDIALSEELQLACFQLCEQYQVDPNLVLAVMYHESKYKADAISRSNDWGLMQINQCNHAWLKRDLGITDFLDPVQNMTAGIHILSMMLNKYNNEHYALMAYNAGEGAMNWMTSNGIYSTSYSRTV